SNRNHPDENGNVLALRSRLSTLAAEAISDFNFSYVPGALAARSETEAERAPKATRSEHASNSSLTKLVQGRTLNGIDVLVKEKFAPLKGLRVGLITNHTGHDR